MAEYPESLFPEITDPLKKAFLAAYAHTGRITQAGRSAQVNWRNHYNWMRSDPTYAHAFADAQRMAGDWLEDEAVRRAKEGILRPIHYQGVHVDDVQEFSDTLLIFLLKGAKPEKYRERLDVRLNIQEAAQRVADEFGVPVDALLAKAQAFLVEPRRVVSTG